MRRDNYHDYLTESELVDCGTYAGMRMLVDSRETSLALRNGARNVTSATLTTTYDMASRCYRMQVSFDSRAWTGGV